MKILFNLSALLLAFVMVGTIACNKDDDAVPTDLSKFYRLKSYEVGVVPAERTVQVLFQVTDYLGGIFLGKFSFLGQIETEAELGWAKDTK